MLKITATTKIELRNVSYSARLSQETNAFAADVYIDGRKAGYAENSGHGGSTSIDPAELDKALSDYAKTLPEIVTDLPDHDDATKFFTYAQSSEGIIDDLLTEWLSRKDLRRTLGRNVLYVDPKARALYALTVKGRAPAAILADPQFTQKYPAAIVLNDLPEDEAMRLYRYFG